MSPSFPADEFDKLKQETLAGLEQQKTIRRRSPAISSARVSRPHLTSEDPRYTRTFPEEAAAIESTTREQAVEFYRAFYGASHATAAVVGDFDPAAVQAALAQAFGDRKSPSPYVRMRGYHPPTPARDHPHAR